MFVTLLSLGSIGDVLAVQPSEKVTKTSFPKNCQPQTDATYQKLLVGKWLSGEEPTIGNKTYQAKTVFHADGTFETNIINKDNPAETLITCKGKWEVKDGKFHDFAYHVEPKQFFELFEDTFDTLQCASRDYYQSQAEDGVILRSIASRVKVL